LERLRRNGSRGAAFEGPRQVHRCLEVGRVVHLHVNLDVFGQPAHEELRLLARVEVAGVA
jgi:hypothetical protein